MHPDPLDQPSTPALLQALYARGHLSAEARDTAILIVRPHLAWWRWAGRLVLLLGAALLLAGIVFFFAYNWAAMPRFARLALLEAGIVGSALASAAVGLRRLGGRVLLLGASLLVGVFLAVFGQVYQTGADAFELFRGWALLISGWVLISRFAGLWVMWLTITNAALLLYWEQVGRYELGIQEDSLFVLLGLFNGLFLAAREYGVSRGLEWVRGEWIRVVLLLATLCYLEGPIIHLIFEPEDLGWLAIPVSVAWLGALAGSYRLYRYHFRDLFALTLATFGVCVAVLCLIGRVMFEISSDAGTFLLFGLVVLGVCGSAALWLRTLGQGMQEERHG